MKSDTQTHNVTDTDSIQLSAVERLLSSLSHNLKNPLSIMRGNAQLALMASKDEKVGVYVHRIIDAVDSMTEALNEIRCLRKPLESTLETLDFGSVVKNALDNITQLAYRSDVAVCVNEIPQIMVYGNRVMLERSLFHLMRNAVESMTGSGTLKVEAHMHEGKAYVAISDTGSGIPDQYQPLMFRQFFSTKSGGCGWGLVIVDQVMRKSHGGTVQYVTGEHGTTFTVTLPLFVPTDATEELASIGG